MRRLQRPSGWQPAVDHGMLKLGRGEKESHETRVGTLDEADIPEGGRTSLYS